MASIIDSKKVSLKPFKLFKTSTVVSSNEDGLLFAAHPEKKNWKPLILPLSAWLLWIHFEEEQNNQRYTKLLSMLDGGGFDLGLATGFLLPGLRLYQQNEENVEAEKKSAKQSGYVYFIQDTATSNVKIGKSVNPQARLKGLSTANPNLRIVKTVKTHDMSQLEKKYHHQFSGQRIANSEWFVMSEDLEELLAEQSQEYRT